MVTIDEVRRFWDAHPCGAALVDAGDPREFFAGHARERYGWEPHIHPVARFHEFAGRDVLEIGCGIGADGVEFARHGARYTGIDLTETAAAMTRQRLELSGLAGRVLVADARRLPFPDASFDHVYSFGVIHCSPDTPAIVAEIHRVLRPGGTVTVMVYNRASVNYQLEIRVLRRLGRLALRAPGAPAVLARVSGLDRDRLEGHRRLARRRMSDAEWLSANTDGPGCPLATVYGEREAAELFAGFDDVRQSVWFFDRRHWPFVGPRLPSRVVRAVGRRWGWHRVIDARRPG